MTGAHYEGEAERAGITVRVIVDLAKGATYQDADEIAERAGNVAGRLLNQIEVNRQRADQVPF